jgi:hypothetical protein
MVRIVEAMDRVKQRLLEEHCPNVSAKVVHSGYHRGRRRLWGDVFYPDIVSIHHLHLHVIVRPFPVVAFFKYPFWLPLMWKSDQKVLGDLRRQATKRS